jgi:hypothetical protein
MKTYKLALDKPFAVKAFGDFMTLPQAESARRILESYGHAGILIKNMAGE